jgi:hypothetical protein
VTVRLNEESWWAMDEWALAVSMGLVTSLPLAMKVVGGFGSRMDSLLALWDT